jgi:hypothetical protein
LFPAAEALVPLARAGFQALGLESADKNVDPTVLVPGTKTMADLAREEADRYFSNHEHFSSHPEDRHDSGHDSDHDNHNSSEPAYENITDPGTDDEDLSAKMATMTTTKTTYRLPTQTHYANTGPKGVIADAQNFARAKQSTFRQRLASFANNLTSNSNGNGTTTSTSNKRKSFFGTSPKSTTSSSQDSDILALSDEDGDSEFMAKWRAERLAQLSQPVPSQSYNRSPSRRIYGSLTTVDANGYLDAIERVSPDTAVVVLIYDPTSTQSNEVEDELEQLATRYENTRFIKLHAEIAEMESVEVPAVLAYRGGDVFATISGARAEGLEGALMS